MTELEHDVAAFVALVTERRTVEAMTRFYSADVEVRENDHAPRVGKPLNLAWERRNLAALAEPPSLEALAVTWNVTQAVSMIEWRIRCVPQAGAAMVLEEVAVQRWRGRQICAERFFYRELAGAR